jgi:predicted metal-binding protein
MQLARAELIVCETCGGSEREVGGRRQGALLLDHVRELLEANGDVRVDASSVRCLWACSRSCAVMLRSESRVGYVIAGLEASNGAARALLDYAALYVASPDGSVPYKSWPPALKGHFHCRIPRASQVAPPDPHPEGSGSVQPREPELQAKS